MDIGMRNRMERVIVRFHPQAAGCRSLAVEGRVQHRVRYIVVENGSRLQTHKTYNNVERQPARYWWAKVGTAQKGCGTNPECNSHGRIQTVRVGRALVVALQAGRFVPPEWHGRAANRIARPPKPSHFFMLLKA